MKKALVLFLAISLALGLAACGRKPAATDPTAPADPIVDCVNMNEAEQMVGFGMVYAPIEDMGEVQISVIDQRIVQVAYVHENNDLCLRKARSSGGLNSVYAYFPDTSTETVNGTPIALAGEGDRIFCASWSLGDFCYTLSTGSGVQKDIALAIIAAMK